MVDRVCVDRKKNHPQPNHPKRDAFEDATRTEMLAQENERAKGKNILIWML